MATVLDVADCPQCGWRAFYEFETHTLSSSVFCPRCGYQEKTHRNKKRKAKVGEPIFRTTRYPGRGAYLLKRRNGVSEIGALPHPPTRTTIARFKANLKQPEIDAVRSFLTRWNPKRQRDEVVVGKFPRNLP